MFSGKVVGGENIMKESSYKSYDDLPLFLNSATVAKVLGVSMDFYYNYIIYCLLGHLSIQKKFTNKKTGKS